MSHRIRTAAGNLAMKSEFPLADRRSFQRARFKQRPKLIQNRSAVAGGVFGGVQSKQLSLARVRQVLYVTEKEYRFDQLGFGAGLAGVEAGPVLSCLTR